MNVSDAFKKHILSLGLECDIINPKSRNGHHGAIASSLEKYKYIVFEPNIYNPTLINRLCHDIISSHKNPNWYGAEEKEMHIIDDWGRFIELIPFIGLDALPSVAGVLLFMKFL